MRFFFDNCLSPHIARAVRTLVAPEGVIVKYLSEDFDRDVTDEVWIGKLAEGADWVIISGDLRLLKNRHEREALKRSGLTLFVLAKAWMHQKFWDQAWRLIQWWPQIMIQAKLVSAGAAFEVPLRFGPGKFRQLT